MGQTSNGCWRCRKNLNRVRVPAVPNRGFEPVYLTNELGDIDRVDEGGVVKPFDPSVWQWQTRGGRHDLAEFRRDIATLDSLPGFVVEESEGQRYIPGPRTRQVVWGKFKNGAAPPAAQRSLDGAGTRAYFDRLSEAVGGVVLALPANPERAPMIVYDHVAGRRFRVQYRPPALEAAGAGTVYVLEDGFGIKVGYTTGQVAKRIAELQTGNSRKITTLVEIFKATPELEAMLHRELNEWNITGEWFERGPVIARATAAGGLEAWLKRLLGSADWPVIVHPRTGKTDADQSRIAPRRRWKGGSRGF